MSSKTATVKPPANFPVEHPYWGRPAVWRGHGPGLYCALGAFGSAMGRAPARHDWGAYVGFATRDGRPSANGIELVGGLAFAGVGLAGLQINPLLIAGGYVGHGFWDLVHHRHGPYADTPHWYIPFCVVDDWILGAFLLVWWW
jgi:hypothetical protein